MQKKILIILALVICGFLAYNYIYKDHRDIESETSEFTVTANQLANEFKVNSSKAETMYLNKTIEVSGNISEIKPTEITLDEKVFCLFSNANTISKQKQESITIKGRFIGYDDLLEEIKLDQCSIID